jgi:succinate dehydrogenase / fumarate reductase membrane anchor subunit
MGTGTPIGRVRGLGSAKHGAHHWWQQRLTAGSNLFLMAWLMISVARMPGYDYSSVHLWLQSPWAAIPMALLILSVFYHFRLGLQIVIEDYQHDESRIVMMVLLNLFTFTLGGIALFAILKVAFTGAPA